MLSIDVWQLVVFGVASVYICVYIGMFCCSGGS